MHAVRNVIVALVWTLGCREAPAARSAPRTATPAIVPASGSASALPSPDAPRSSATPPELLLRRIHSIAVFDKDELDFCVDTYVDASSPRWELPADHGDEEGVSRIAAKCAETFKGRLVLASCAMTTKGEGGRCWPQCP